MFSNLFEKVGKRKLALIFGFIVIAVLVSLLVPMNHLDSNIHLDYVRSIQEMGQIPKYHPHLYQSSITKIPFPYPIGYHLFMSFFPHSVLLYKILQVLFAAVSLFALLEINKLFGYEPNPLIITPLFLSFSFIEFTLTPHPDLFGLMLVLVSVFSTLKYLREEDKIFLLLAAFTGFYACFSREISAITLFFAWIVIWLKFPQKRNSLIKTAIPIVILSGMGYYLTNPVLKGTSILYPVRGFVDQFAYQWYSSHVSLWNVLQQGYWVQAIGTVVTSFSIFLILFFTKPRDKKIAIIFGLQIVSILVFMPSTAGLDRYVMFTLPFFAIAYGNIFKSNKKCLALAFIGMAILVPVQGYKLESSMPDDFNRATKGVDSGDFVLAREQGQIAYRRRCDAGWTSLFWSGDLYRTFENEEKLENFINNKGVTHVLVNKKLIISSSNPMIGAAAVEFPRNWVREVRSLGTLVRETDHYELYRVNI